jgi:hypothetical protein
MTLVTPQLIAMTTSSSIKVKPRRRHSGSAIIFTFQLESFADALHVRFQIQQHKIIWPPEQRGV